MNKLLLWTLFSLLYHALPAQFQAGDLDPSFGNAGIDTFSFGSFDIARDIAIQTDQKILATGRTAVTPNNLDMLLVRLLPDGSPDSTFGTNGIVQSALSGWEEGKSVLVQDDGKILVAGYTDPLSNFAYEATVWRFLSDGSVDTGFGNNGVVKVVPASDFSELFDMVLYPSGKIAVAGRLTESASNISEFMVARLNADGSLDPTFDSDGLFNSRLDPYNVGAARSIGLLSNNILVAGAEGAVSGGDEKLILVGLDTLGQLSAAINPPTNDGVAVINTTSDHAHMGAVAIQTDDKILALGDRRSNLGNQDRFVFDRREADGTADNGFSSSSEHYSLGLNTTANATCMGLQADGRILLGAFRIPQQSGSNEFAIARILPNGEADTSFAAQSLFISNWGLDEELYGLAVQADGKILACGHIDRKFAIIRLFAEDVLVEAAGAEDLISDVMLVPNPIAGDEVMLQFKLAESTKVDVSILDPRGEVVWSGNMSMEAGLSRKRIDLDGIPIGFYLVNIQAEGRAETLRLSKIH